MNFFRREAALVKGLAIAEIVVSAPIIAAAVFMIFASCNFLCIFLLPAAALVSPLLIGGIYLIYRRKVGLWISGAGLSIILLILIYFPTSYLVNQGTFAWSSADYSSFIGLLLSASILCLAIAILYIGRNSVEWKKPAMVDKSAAWSGPPTPSKSSTRLGILRKLRKEYWVIMGIALVIVAYFFYVPFSKPGSFRAVEGIGIDSQDNVYIVDWWNDRIQKFDKDGNFLWAWRTEVTDVAIDRDGYVYGIEGWTEKVTKFTSSGIPTKDWGATRTGGREYVIISDIVMDSRGDLYIVDIRDSVTKYSRDGVLLAKWGSQNRTNGDGTLRAASALAIDSHDNLYVLLEHSGQIQKFKLYDPKSSNMSCPAVNVVSDGVCYVTKWNASGTRGLAVDSKGNVYVGNWHNVIKYDSNGNLLGSFGDYITLSTDNTRSNSQIGDVAIDSHDNVYVASNDCGWIIKYSTDGEQLDVWGTALSTGGFSPSSGYSCPAP